VGGFNNKSLYSKKDSHYCASFRVERIDAYLLTYLLDKNISNVSHCIF